MVVVVVVFCGQVLAPKLSPKDRQTVNGISRLLAFLLGDVSPAGNPLGNSNNNGNGNRGAAASAMQALMTGATRPGNRQRLSRALPVLREFAPAMRDFGLQISRRLVEKNTARVLRAGADAIFGPMPVAAGATATATTAAAVAAVGAGRGGVALSSR